MVLSRGERKEWEGNSLDENLMRSGCLDLWDAIFMSFSWYREIKNQEKQKEEIRKRLGDMTGEIEDWVNRIRNELYFRANNMGDDTDMKIFFSLISLRAIESTFLPFLREMTETQPSREEFHEKAMEGILMLAQHRMKKKIKDVDFEDVRESIQTAFGEIIANAFQSQQGDVPDEYLIKAGEELEHNIVLITPEEKVLFDTQNLIPDSQFRDNILVLVLPDGYESLGRISYTRDGHKKLSRIFSFDDSLMTHLRSSLKKE